ncbi:hypothetical protein LJB84_02670 [Bacteroidales bacterium OttesenSCG-928-J19]|nr:hypothetical protein [Bacteroidales bacterium OttesenSCG-928-J19]
MKKVKNFARFYALLNKAQADDKEEVKEMLVGSFTSGRTTSLREMTPQEYNAMCDSMDDKKARPASAINAELKKQRSAVLHRLQKLGVDTTDWSAVDEFCLNSRIAGKKFYNLTAEELGIMVPKLEAIARKPAKPKPAPEKLKRKPEVDALIMDSYVRNLLTRDIPKHLLN